MKPVFVEQCAELCVALVVPCVGVRISPRLGEAAFNFDLKCVREAGSVIFSV